jgi:hypothetical protein
VWLDVWNGFVSWERTWGWGTVPDWVGGVGTAAAFLIAALGYVRSVNTRKVEQARLVYAKLTAGDVCLEGKPISGKYLTDLMNSRRELVRWDEEAASYLATRDFGSALVVVVNRSDQMLASLDRVGIVGWPGAEPWSVETALRPLEPGEEREMQLLRFGRDGTAQSSVPFIEFMDASGVRWRRDGGHPIRQLHWWNRRAKS